MHHFVTDETNGPSVRAKVVFGSNARGDDPDPKANLRLTYALQGSATLVRALVAVADRSIDDEQSDRYRAKADGITDLCLAIGDQFYRDYADIEHPGRYFLYPDGISEIDVLEGLSHNNSQSYLIEGMAALANLDREPWAPRLKDLLAFIKTQRDQGSGLLHEFDFRQKGIAFPHDAVSKMEGAVSWQSQDNRETVVLGHTLAGSFAGPARLIADSSDSGRLQEMTSLLEDFAKTMNLIQGVKENGLPANAFQLIPNGDRACVAMPWPAGAWQPELLWQFLLHADRAGVDLKQFEIKAGSDTLTLDRLLARGLDYHDKHLFNGVHYVTQDGDPFRGRQYAAPINHAADTLRDLALNLR